MFKGFFLKSILLGFCLYLAPAVTRAAESEERIFEKVQLDFSTVQLLHRNGTSKFKIAPMLANELEKLKFIMRTSTNFDLVSRAEDLKEHIEVFAFDTLFLKPSDLKITQEKAEQKAVEATVPTKRDAVNEILRIGKVRDAKEAKAGQGKSTAVADSSTQNEMIASPRDVWESAQGERIQYKIEKGVAVFEPPEKLNTNKNAKAFRDASRSKKVDDLFTTGPLKKFDVVWVRFPGMENPNEPVFYAYKSEEELELPNSLPFGNIEIHRGVDVRAELLTEIPADDTSKYNGLSIHDILFIRDAEKKGIPFRREQNPKEVGVWVEFENGPKGRYFFEAGQALPPLFGRGEIRIYRKNLKLTHDESSQKYWDAVNSGQDYHPLSFLPADAFTAATSTGWTPEDLLKFAVKVYPIESNIPQCKRFAKQLGSAASHNHIAD